MGHSGQLIGCGACDPDVQFGVELARVAGDNFGIQLLCELYGAGGFARRSGSEDEQETADSAIVWV